MPPYTPVDSPSLCAMNDSVRATPADSSVGLASAQSATFDGEATHQSRTGGLVSQSDTTRSESGNGSGRNTMLFTTVNMLVVAPIPSAIVTITAAVNDGALRSVRTAKRRSRRRDCIGGSLREAVRFRRKEASCVPRGAPPGSPSISDNVSIVRTSTTRCCCGR